MNKFLIIKPFLFLCLSILVSCGQVVSKNPLPIKDSKVDDRILGTWQTKINKHKSYVHIGRFDNGMYQALLVEFNNDGSYDYLEFDLYTTEINKKHYMNIKLNSSSIETAEELEANDIKDSYLIAEYGIDKANSLHISLLNGDKIQTEPEQGELSNDSQGDLNVKTLKNYKIINESSNELKKIITKQDAFKSFCIFEKIK